MLIDSGKVTVTLIVAINNNHQNIQKNQCGILHMIIEILRINLMFYHVKLGCVSICKVLYVNTMNYIFTEFHVGRLRGK